jgi:hypothetical protein
MSESIQINNEVLTFSKIWYLDANNGSDTTGDGSKNKPFKTIQGFVSVAISLGTVDNTHAVFFSPGTYVYVHTRGDSIFFPSLIGTNPLNTIISTANTHDWDRGFLFLNNVNLIGLTIQQNDAAAGASYLFGSWPDIININIYNCIFNKFVRGYSTFDNLNAHFYNTIFTYTPTLYGGSMEFKNCVYPGGSGYNLNYNNITFDQAYNIVSGGAWLHTGDPTILNPDGTRCNIGIYGGPYYPNLHPNWHLLNQGLTEEPYQISVGSSAQEILDNFEFQLEDGTIIPHEILDYYGAKVRLKLPKDITGTYKIYLKYKGEPTHKTIEVPPETQILSTSVDKLQKAWKPERPKLL